MDFINKNELDFDLLVDVLKGIRTAPGVLNAEVLIDEEIKEKILVDYLNDAYCPPPISQWGDNAFKLNAFSEKKKAYKKYYQSTINFYRKMGYSLFADMTFISNFESINSIVNKTDDTAQLNKGIRHWAVEDQGMIKTWDDFEKFPWKLADDLNCEYIELLDIIKQLLPDGMKIGVIASLFEEPLEWIFGYQNFFFLLTDNRDLVKAVFDKVGEIMLNFYRSVIDHESVGCIFHADDLGYKTGTMLSLKDLNELVFPWFKKYSEIAHNSNKPFFLHSCGKKDEIMDILIDDIGIDAIHAFEDVSYPIIKYKEIWGEKVGIIGGADVDKLTRLGEQDLRDYVRKILDFCVLKGRYIFGSGNSITNYIPVKNYLIMLDECNKWSEKNIGGNHG